jgi:hypothetical protein
MFKYLLNTCKDCDSVKETLTLLDKKIAQLTTNNYQNLVFQLTKPFDHSKLKKLIVYKGLLINLYFNKNYYYPYDYKVIVSKAKTLL